MPRVILAFFVVMVLFHFGIQAWRSATNKQRWTTIKTLTYSVFLAILTTVAMVLLVILF